MNGTMFRLVLLALCVSFAQSIDLSNISDQQLQIANNTDGDAPKYNEALQKFNKVFEKIMYLLYPYKPDGSEQSNIRNTPVRIVFVVLDGIVNLMAEMVGASYNGIYESQSVRLYRYAEDHAELVSKRLLCVFHALNDSIRRLREIRENKRVNKLCTEAPSFCNDVIQVIIDADDEKALEKEAKVLIALGKLTEYYPVYERLLAPVIKREDDWSALEFLVQYKSTLRPLIMATVSARNSDLGKDSCEKLDYE